MKGFPVVCLDTKEAPTITPRLGRHHDGDPGHPGMVPVTDSDSSKRLYYVIDDRNQS